MGSATYGAGMQPDLTHDAAIESASSPGFAKDGQAIFHLRGAGLQQVWRLDLETSESLPLTRLDGTGPWRRAEFLDQHL